MRESGRKPGRGKNGAGDGGAGDGIGGLVGAGSSVVGLSGSMRARDVSRIRDADLAEAERTLVIRRRPPDPEPPSEG